LRLKGDINYINTVFEAIPACVVVTDCDGNIEYVNPIFETLTGYTADEAAGMNPRILQSGKHDEVYYKIMWDTIKSGGVWRGEFINKKKNGELYHEQATIAPVKNENNEIVKFIAIKIDITARKKYEEQLSLQSLMLDQVADNIYLVDNNGRIVYTNYAVEKSHGYTRDEAMKMNVADFDVEPDAALAKKRIDELMVKGGLSFEVSHYSRDKQIIPFEVTARVINFQDDRYILAVNRDISERKKIENDLRRSETLYKTLVSKLPDYVFIVSEGKIVYINDTITKDFGYTLNEITQMQPLDFISDRYRTLVAENIVRRMKGEDIPAYEVELLTREGSYRPIIFNGALIDYNEKPSILGVGTDITVRKNIETALLESEARLNSIINSIPNPVFYKDTEGRYQMCNRAFEEYLGLPSEKIIGATVFDVAPVELAKIYYESDKKMYENGISETYEAKVKYADGTLRDILFYKSPVNGADGMVVGLVGVMLDITESKKLYSKLEGYTEELKELNATKDRFLSLLSHDLRNPFHALIGFSEMIMNYAEEFDTDQIKEFGRLMNDSAVKGHSLLENLLEWSRTKTGRMPFRPETVDLASSIRETIVFFAKNISDKRISTVIEVSDNIKVTADRNMLNAVLRNLISNAVKFTPEAGKIQISSRRSGSSIETAVSDSGIGIKPEDIEKLFSLDSKLSTPGTAGEKSTGLGLVLCGEFIEKCGGTIRVESVHGAGSVFYFTLPAAE
jgi:PAS domain S-box-containing protein